MDQKLTDFLLELAVILLLILANGVFAMAEMSIVSARKVRLQQRADDGDVGSKNALELTQHPNRFLSTVQIGITLISTLTGALGGISLAGPLEAELNRFATLRPYSHGLSLGIIVVLVTYTSLILGELVPKRLALSNPEKIAARVAGPMRVLSTIGRPMVWLLSISTEGILRLLRIRHGNDVPVTPEEITGLMEEGEQVGVFEEAETDIVESIFRLGDLRAGALMTPRTEIDWLDLDDTFDLNLKFVIESPHMHFPVARGSLDDVAGILRGKDLLAKARESAHGEPVDLNVLILPTEFIPESMPALEVLEVLKSAPGNLGLVIDEYGGLLGLVTLFDVMEAMVGGISERGEPVVPEAIQREDGSWLVEGMMRIDEMKKLLDVDSLPGEDRVGYQTAGGFIMAQIGDVPVTGQHFECCGWRFEVVDMDGMRVDKVLVSQAKVE